MLLVNFVSLHPRFQTEATVFLQGSDTAHFELLERHVQFNTSEVLGHSRREQDNSSRDWRGIQKGVQSFPTDVNDQQWEAAPVQPVGQRSRDFPAHQHQEIATPRLRPLPQYSASSAAVTDPARTSEVPLVSQGNVNGQNELLSQTAGAPEIEGSPSIPPELMNLLSWQNEQLRRLQDQVKICTSLNFLVLPFFVHRCNSFWQLPLKVRRVSKPLLL